jgi:hypothetical protein
MERNSTQCVHLDIVLQAYSEASCEIFVSFGCENWNISVSFHFSHQGDLQFVF